MSSCTVKKRLAIFSSPTGMSHTKHWPGIIILFPARESLVSDIAAGDGKLANLFFTVCTPFLQGEINYKREDAAVDICCSAELPGLSSHYSHPCWWTTPTRATGPRQSTRPTLSRYSAKYNRGWKFFTWWTNWISRWIFSWNRYKKRGASR